MKINPKIKKIPTSIGLIIISVGLIISFFLIKKSRNLFTQAEADKAPNQIKISNITDTSFTISWFTLEETLGWVQFGTNPDSLNQRAEDDRDQEKNKKEKFFSHHITLSNLKPSTTYYFQIYSDSKMFDNNGSPHKVNTGPKIPPPANDVSFGMAVKPDGTSAEGAIVYLSLANSTLQTSLVTSTGNWAIPLNLTRTKDLTRYSNYDPTASVIDIFVQGQEGEANAITTTSNDNPVPTITLGESFDFRKKIPTETEKQIKREERPTESGFVVEKQTDLSTVASTFPLEITNPRDGEKVNTSKPLIIGKGPAGKEIEIKIKSPQYAGKTIINNQGTWNWVLPEELEPGKHTVTASYTDEKGKTHQISHNFIVLAAEESDLPSFTASPSATPEVSPTTTPVEEPTETPVEEPTETPVEEPTETPVEEPTETPVEEPTETPVEEPTETPVEEPTETPVEEPTETPTVSELTATPTPAVPGILTPTLVIFTIGAMLISSGVFIAYL